MKRLRLAMAFLVAAASGGEAVGADSEQTPQEQRRALRMARATSTGRADLADELGWRLAKPLRRAQPLSASHLDAGGEAPLQSLPERLEGMRARRHLREGAMLRSSDLERVPVVARGQPVQAFVRHGPLTVTMSAEAMSDGGLGEVVRLQNRDTRRKLEGVVVGPGLVEVKQ